MQPEESLYPEEWLRIAEKDLARVERMLADDDPEAAGFYLQQGLEKYLKAFLLSKGWSLKRIHDLETLLNDASVYNPSLGEFRLLCQEITGYYMVERYPFSGMTSLTNEEVKEALESAKTLIDRLISHTE